MFCVALVLTLACAADMTTLVVPLCSLARVPSVIEPYMQWGGT